MKHDLLAPSPKSVILELTTRCNLRCLYCALSQPGFHGQDFDLERSGLLEQLVQLDLESVQINGHGETTIVPGWTEIALALRAAGVAVSLTTNLCKRLSALELEALAGMQSITLSCDTVDPELFARLRRPARLERLERNLARLRAVLPPRPAERPYLAVNCTLSSVVVSGLTDLVRWAAQRGFDCVSLVSWIEYPSVDPGFRLRHPADVDPLGTITSIREARELALASGLDFHVMDGLAERLQEASLA